MSQVFRAAGRSARSGAAPGLNEYDMPRKPLYRPWAVEGWSRPMDRFDYVIVGAGSDGCVLANRLTEDGASVLLLEYGCGDGAVVIQMPSALSIPMNMARYNWAYETEPE